MFVCRLVHNPKGLQRFFSTRGLIWSGVTAFLGVAMITLTGCGSGTNIALSTNGNGVTLQGKVKGGEQPVVGANIQLYAVGTTGDGTAATPMLTTTVTTGNGGEFTITGDYTCPSITTEMYLVATGGNPGLPAGSPPNTALSLMAALGNCGDLTSATHIIINEATTVGSVWPLAQFMNSYLKVGSGSSDALALSNAFMLVNEFIDTDGGDSPGPQLPTGFGAPIAEVYSMADILSSCVNSAGGVAGDGSPCGNLFALATPSGGPAPTDVIDAALNIAKNPTQNVVPIYNLSSASVPFLPVLTSAPPDWTMKILPEIMVSLPSSLVGISSTQTATITLGQAAPAGGLMVNLAATGSVSVTTTPIMIAVGATTATFSYTGGTVGGPATITASATGYISDTESLTATGALVSLGTIPTVAPGQSVSLPLSLGTPAPAGGVTVNFTSDNPAIATVTPSVFITAGLQVPVTNPQVTGVKIGTANITGTATGYAPGTRGVSVSVTAALSQNLATPVSFSTNATLTISAPAPVGGIMFTLSTDNTGVATVPASVTVLQGATTTTIPVLGVSAGTTTLRADSPNIMEATSTVMVASGLGVSGPVTTGYDLETAASVSLPITPPTATSVTVAVQGGSTAVVKLSTSATASGSASITYSNVITATSFTFYVQGVSLGTATLTVNSPGYNQATINVTVDPSGFVIYSPGNSFSTTTFSTPTGVVVRPAILNPGSLTLNNYGQLSPVGGPVNVAVTSTSTTTGVSTVGTVVSPLTFNGGDSSQTSNFQPVAAGTTTISLTTPSGGFSPPTPASATSITATVTAPAITGGSVTTGAGLETTGSFSLPVAPPVPTLVTVTSNDPTVALLSMTATATGSASLPFPNITAAQGFSIFVQGVKVGTTTLTVTAAGYTNGTISVTVDPSGFVIYSPGNFTTTTFSTPTSVVIRPAILNPGSLTLNNYAQLSPLNGAVSVPVTSTSTTTGVTTVGTVTSPIVFNGGDTTQTSSFQPVAAGTTTIAVGTPTVVVGGANLFSTPTPASATQIIATVTANPINSGGPVTTGVFLETAASFSLSHAPPVPTTVTIISDTPLVATISTGPTIFGSATTTFPNVTAAQGFTIYVQGQKTGTATLTISAPGYSSTTIAVTVDPSGFVFYSPSNFSTTTFSTPTSIVVRPAILNPGSLTLLNYAQLNPGISTISVPLTSGTPSVGSITTSPLVFSAGDTSESSSFQPLAAGTTTLSLGAPPAPFATATPLATQQITATVTAPQISGSTTVTTGVNLQMPVSTSLPVTAPSPITVTVTSNSPTIATVSKSATVVGTPTVTFTGVTSGTQSFYIQGLSLGSTTITISAPGYSNATINVTVDPSGFVIYSPASITTTTFSTSTGITVRPAVLNLGTLTLNNYAYLNPGIGSVSVSMTNSNAAIGTLSGTPFVFNAGDTSQSTGSFQPLATGGGGTATLALVTPGGFSTPSDITSQQIPVTITAPNISAGAVTTGISLEIPSSASLTQAPPSAVTVTLTIADSTVALLSSSSTAAGVKTLPFSGITGTTVPQFWLQGLKQGSTTVTVSAPGYNSATFNVTVLLSGFVVYTPGSITTTTFSGSSGITVRPVILNTGVLTLNNYAYLSPGIGSVSVGMTNSNPLVGTLSGTPFVFNAGDTTQSTGSFQPSLAGGTTTLTLVTPTGFSTPSAISSQQVPVAVTAPNINVGGTVTTGIDLEVQDSIGLAVAPPSPVAVTLTSSDPTTVVLSASATVAGTAAPLVFTGVSGSSVPQFYVQGLKETTTPVTVTVSAPGYNTATFNVTVLLSGFVFYSPSSITTTVGAATTSVSVRPAIINPGVLTFNSYADLSPANGPVSVPVGSTNLFVGTISNGTLIFNPGDSTQSTSFQPVGTGVADIDLISQPTGFTTPSDPSTQQIPVTVN
jgi:hypothetical protein